ncbi:type II toxin-antitoxin system death-on-curing family toxin [soil metagenome]
MTPIFITVTQAIKYHTKLVAKVGGIPGIRDKKLLESAMAQPQMTLFGSYACKSIFEMAAAYCYHIAKNHPIVDGNKRTALLVTLVLLKKNGYVFKPKTDLYQLVFDVAASQIYKEANC